MRGRTQKIEKKMGRNTVPVMGTVVDSGRRTEVLKRACDLLSQNPTKLSGSNKRKFSLIVTPNPEIVSRARHDRQLALILNSASLAVPDGIGIVAAMRFLSLPAPKNKLLRLPVLILEGKLVGLATILARGWLKNTSDVLPGRLLAEDLIKFCSLHGKKIFLLGGKSHTAELAANNLATKYNIPDTKYQFAGGPWLDNAGKPINKDEQKVEQAVVRQINAFKPELLLVGFGAPKQEKWLSRYQGKLNVRVAMVVGGMIDYTAGILPPPPGAFSDLGFEWLWRLVTQPKRIKRILTALVVFPWLVFVWKLKEE